MNFISIVLPFVLSFYTHADINAYDACIQSEIEGCDDEASRNPNYQLYISEGDVLVSPPGYHYRALTCQDKQDGLLGPSAKCTYPYSSSPIAPMPVPDTPYGKCGSIIQVDTGVLGESIPIQGTPFSLIYMSDRVKGYQSAFKLKIPLTGDTLRTGQTQVKVDIAYSDRLYTNTYAATTNMSENFLWDGLDSTSAETEGGTKATVTITSLGSGTYYPSTQIFDLGVWKVNKLGLGLWSLDVVHFYDTNLKRLVRGDGSGRYVAATVLSGGELQVAEKDGSLVYEFDSAGRHLRTRHGLTGAVVYTFTYDTNGRLLSLTDANSNVTTINRDPSSHEITGIVGPYGQTTAITLDSHGFVSDVQSADGKHYLMTYWNGDGQLKTFQKPNGLIATFDYDSDGKLISDSNNANKSLSLSVSYADSGQTQTDLSSGMGRTSTVVSRRWAGTSSVSTETYSRTVTYPSGYQSQFTIQPSAEESIDHGMDTFLAIGATKDARFPDMVPFYSLYQYTSPFGVGSTYSSSQALVPATISDPFTFDTLTFNNADSWTGLTATTAYATATNQFTYTSQEGRVSTKTIDLQGRPIAIQEGGLTPVSFSYDTHGRLNNIVQGSRSETIAYDSNGYVSSVTDPNSLTTSFTNDVAGRVLAKTLPDTRTVAYTYSDNGKLLSVTPPGRASHSFTRTLLDFIASYLPPALGGSTVNTTYGYNDDGDLTTITRPDGQVITFGYLSNMDRLSSITASSGNYSYLWTSQDIVSTAVAPNDIKNGFLYDGLLLKRDAVSQNVTGDSYGQVDMTYTNHFQYASDKVTSTDGTTTSLINFTYDADDFITAAGSETLTRRSGDGLLDSTALGNVTDSYSYNSFGEVTGYTANYSGTPIYSYTLTRDNSGRISAKSETIKGVTTTYGYTYDDAGRLTAVSENGSPSSSYTYDSNSNIVSGTQNGSSLSAAYDSQDRLNSWNSNTYSYNLNGDLTSIHRAGATTDYVYDVLGGLLSATQAAKSYTFQFDGLHRREAKFADSTLKERYLYRKNQLLAILDASGAIAKRFVYASKQNVPDYMVAGGNTYRIISDHLGSPRLVVDVATGNVAERIDYNEFGKILRDSNTCFQPFAFAGGIWDNDTKLLRFGARDYDPEVGRWTSKDPILFDGGSPNLYSYVGAVGKVPMIDANLYVYALSDPINFTDPSGLYPDGWPEPDDSVANGAAIQVATAGLACAAGIAAEPAVTNFCLINPGICQSAITGSLTGLTNSSNIPNPTQTPWQWITGQIGQYVGQVISGSRK